MKLIIPIFILFIMLCSFTLHGVKSPKVIQFDIRSILNARPVTVVYKGKLQTWSIGIDGDGKADGYLTQAAAAFVGDSTTHALPNNAIFPANDYHPAIKLNYSNSDYTNNQAVSISGEGNKTINIPKAAYSAIYLALTSAEGASSISIELTYTDGKILKDFVVPDYYQDLKSNDTNFCYLAHNLAKWGPQNNMTEKDHHNIDLLTLHPDSTRKLTAVKLMKTKAAYLLLWAAAGVKALN